jgi:hypothetical protein
MKFITKYGEQILDFPGYFEAYELQRINAQLAQTHTHQEIVSQASFYAFSKDVYEYNIMIGQLTDNKIRFNWNRSLDIGGMEGTVSRLFAGTALSNISDCVDIHDYTPQIPDHVFSRYLNIWRLLNCTYPRKLKYNFNDHFGSNLKKLDVGRIVAKPKINNYFTDGFIGFKPDYKYDFVSALLCMPYFKLDEFFGKLTSVMEPGGIFYMLSDYWWGQCNSSALTGGVPWAVQRLERDDFLKYFHQCYPQIDREYLINRMNYYHHGEDRPTLTSYLKIAEKHGFSVMAANRFYSEHTDNERVFFSFNELESNGFVNDAMRDIRHFRGDVSAIDLRTNFISCIFRKNA